MSDQMERLDSSSNQRQSSDHPGAQIVATKLTGPNFMKWSRTVKIALCMKGKLGFIDGSCTKPDQDSLKFGQ